MTQTKAVCPRIGLIGVAGYGQIYLDLLLASAEAGRADFCAAAVIPSQQGLDVVGELRARGVRIYSGYEEMMEAERGTIELYLIPTGIQWHSRMAIAAMRAGANVLVEKPLAGSVEDAEAVRRCERETNRWVAVGFQDIYASENHWFKERLVGGAIGRLRSVRVIGLWPRHAGYYRRNHWAGRLHIDGAAALDSPFNNAFAHFVNLALYLAGPEVDRSAEVELVGAELMRAHEIESFDSAVVRARSTDEVDFWFGLTHASRVSREPEIHLQGEAGEAGWYHERYFNLHREGEAPEQRPVPDYSTTRQSMFEAVLAKVARPEVRICDTSLALQHTRLIEALHREGTIRTVRPERIEHVRLDGDPYPVPSIIGLDTALEQARRRAVSLEAVGFSPWQTVQTS